MNTHKRISYELRAVMLLLGLGLTITIIVLAYIY